ncbi:L-seryl-tRNA(Sec) selenium transferase [Fictibacillus phosphorivorans]|uniref:L-seryl-tRNA(Sec) selenium transferase n=1 Tax=Fictibacillus phosphorivorans TaxID=1221500 RepID=UPI00203E2C86|nr:L-seryl-tRNA(Sec) selenium transferase [Fictibacillus phosphorivorans]MCM3717037.1 L-seryl-tRNA(Sec) selenium transferase [Fictibacillus phosphorivorans]MCM3774724.1 L-seryl-tRNA(Sec) selenium transferase [Fictibacillus phosphorivorans]
MHKSDLLRQLPSVHEITKEISIEVNGINEKEITRTVRDTVALWRTRIQHDLHAVDLNTDIHELIKQTVIKKLGSHNNQIHKVINASGVVIHTNLGRSRLSEKAVARMTETAFMYSNLEYNLEQGKRGSRHDLTEDLIKRTTGAEAALVVNNNAAAVYLILKALAKNREVIVSRGELVEIGGSFRVSSIMEESGARLKEVGTTNKTHYADYENAMSDNTAMVMKVHTSNFKVIGFTKSVSSEELRKLKKNSPEVIIYEDLGSGALYPFQSHGIGEEPVVSSIIDQGIDLVSFSGDKLLGGPQAGIIAGKKKYIDILKKHQLARVLRVDKFTIAALNETLNAYLNEEILSIPTVRDILKTPYEIKMRTRRIKDQIIPRPNLEISITDDFSKVGGGTMPEVRLPTSCLVLKHDNGASYLANLLRDNHIPIIVRIKDEEVRLDLRTVTEEEEVIIVEAINALDG